MQYILRLSFNGVQKHYFLETLAIGPLRLYRVHSLLEVNARTGWSGREYGLSYTLGKNLSPKNKSASYI